MNRCARSPECGDGYACDGEGICRRAEGRVGDACKSEVECEPGLSCQIDGTSLDEENRLRASCTASAPGRPAGSECFVDTECRNGTCAMGHCVDLCLQTRDCAANNTCMVLPRVEASGSLFGGCLPAGGNISWTIPVISPTTAVLLPVPSEASYASLVFEVDDAQQRVGAIDVTAPSGSLLYQRCPDGASMCTPAVEETQYYANAVRHTPELGLSVLAMPSNPANDLETGVYRVNASSFRPNGTPGTAIPKVTAVVRIGSGGSLDLHLHFLDLGDHPCRAAFKNTRLDATAAANEDFFKQDFLGRLNTIFTTASIAIGTVTYDDITDHPDLDGLDVTNAGALLSLGKYETGINVFFVRSISPVGLQGYGPGPGPAGLARTRGSGIVVGVDTLCYRTWDRLARLTAHEIARYMGLYHNVETNVLLRDQINDSNESHENLMFYSELGGSELSNGQRDILSRSAILR
ncbi:MAG: hypothetical protein M4D80_41750 [Myxococcota bacterium]|nr:hypothetical protein [Deltaproteobacteria bacterium]MDQ3341717.1 hypothetical protein [Myxococcota bacterium]